MSHRAGFGNGIGPELTEIGNRRSGAAFKEILLHPENNLPTNFMMIQVKTPDGKTISGARVNEDTVSLQLRDATGKFHSFRKDKLAIGKRSLAKPGCRRIRARILTIWLLFLRAKGGSHENLDYWIVSNVMAVAQVPYSRLMQPDPESWLTYSGNYSSYRYSPLTQIDSTNVSKLRLQWIYQSSDYHAL